MSDWDGVNRRETSLVERWITPTSIMALVGGLIWGVQLNSAVVSLSEEVHDSEIIQKQQEEEIQEIADTLLRITLIVERLENQSRDNP